MPFFSKKNVYHSWLVKRSPVVVQFTSDVMESKYPDKPPFVYFKVRGDDDPEASYLYSIDTPEIQKKIESAARGRWYKASFYGEQLDDGSWDQSIELDDAGEAPAPKSNGGSVGGKYNVSSDVNIVEKLAACIEEATGLAELLPDDASNEDVRSIASSLFIQWSYRSFSGEITGDEAGPSNEAVDLLNKIDALDRETGEAHDGSDLKKTLSGIRKMISDDDIKIDRYLSAGQWLVEEAEFQNNPPEDEEEDQDDLPF